MVAQASSPSGKVLLRAKFQLNKLQKIFHEKKAESKDIENIFRIFLKDEKKRKASL